MILRRIEGSRFSETLKLWGGLTAVIIAGGPSLTRDQVDRVEQARNGSAFRVIAVNDAYLLAPWADVQYAADARWHRWQEEGIPKPLLGLTGADVRERWASFAGQKCSIENDGPAVVDPSIHMLRNAGEKGLSLDPRALVTGRNSGFQALNLAVLAGARRLILLGFDGQPGAGGKEHFHGGHPQATPRAAFQWYRQCMSAAENALNELGVAVINCSPGTAIDTFPKARLEDVLC